MTFVDLSGNRLNLAACESICDMMKSNETIKHLAFANNGLSKDHLSKMGFAKAIAAMLKVNRALTSITFDGTASNAKDILKSSMVILESSMVEVDLSGKGLGSGGAQITAAFWPKMT